MDGYVIKIVKCFFNVTFVSVTYYEHVVKIHTICSYLFHYYFQHIYYFILNVRLNFWLLCNTSLIIVIISFLGVFVYMFSMSKERTLVSLFSSVVFSSVNMWLQLRTFYVHNIFKQLYNVFVYCFAISYAGPFFQSSIGPIGVWFI
jgi:hypothetical protein